MMGIVHRLSKSVIQSDDSIETNLVIVDQSMIEVFVTIIETKYARKFLRGQVVTFKNAQMGGKIRRLKTNNFQIEPNNEKAFELRKWYSTNRHASFKKINTTTIDNNDDDDPFN